MVPKALYNGISFTHQWWLLLRKVLSTLLGAILGLSVLRTDWMEKDLSHKPFGHWTTCATLLATDSLWKTPGYHHNGRERWCWYFPENLLNWESRRLPGSFASCLQLPARRCCQGSEAYEPAPSSIVTSEVRPIPLIFDADSFSTPAAAPEPNILQAWFALSVCWGILSQTLVYNLR